MLISVDPEYATIGGLVLAPHHLDAVAPWLDPSDFKRPLCGEFYELLVVMRSRNETIDPITVLGELRRLGRLRPDGYPANELVEMIEAVPATAMTVRYAQLVLEGASFRAVERCGSRLTQIGRHHAGRPDDAFAGSAAAWQDLAEIQRRWQRSERPASSGSDGHVRQIEGRDRGQQLDVSRSR